MPYIDQDRRNALDEKRADPATTADLDYIFAAIIDKYHADNGLRFEKIAEVLAALDSTVREYYRRIAGPYEQAKAIENGDVFVQSAALLAGTRPSLAALTPGPSKLQQANAAADAVRQTDTAESVQADREPADSWADDATREEREQIGGVTGKFEVGEVVGPPGDEDSA